MNVKLAKSEEFAVYLIKIILIISLVLALLGTVTYLGLGVKELSSVAVETNENPIARKPSINSNYFIDSTIEFNKPQVIINDEKIEVKDPLNDVVNQNIKTLWGAFDGYQKKCVSPILIDEQTFINSFPRQVIKQWFKEYGDEFILSQNIFVTGVLSNPSMIELCKRKNGNAQIFTRSLDWHKNQWIAQLNSINNEIKSEEDRVARFRENEYLRIQKEHAKGMSEILGSLYPFGAFMFFAFFILMGKMETNLKLLSKDVDR